MRPPHQNEELPGDYTTATLTDTENDPVLQTNTSRKMCAWGGRQAPAANCPSQESCAAATPTLRHDVRMTTNALNTAPDNCASTHTTNVRGALDPENNQRHKCKRGANTTVLLAFDSTLAA